LCVTAAAAGAAATSSLVAGRLPLLLAPRHVLLVLLALGLYVDGA
jgi:hypothetical protein